MGNRNCYLAVCLDRQNYVAGETCAGKVCVSVNLDFIKCHSLWLRLKGYESTEVHVHATQSHRQSFDRDSFDSTERDRCESNKTVLIHQDHILHTCLPSMHGQGTGLHGGQYEYPFEFIVPHHLPSTLFYRKGQSYCQVRYELSAYIQIQHSAKIHYPFQRQKYQSQDLQLMIRGYNSLRKMNGASPVEIPGSPSSANNSPSPVHFPTETQSIKFWCCFNRGQMRLDAQLSMDHPSSSNGNEMHFNSTNPPTLMPHVPYLLTYKISNESTAVINSIQMELMQSVTWIAGNDEEKDQTKIVKKSIDGKALGLEVNGLNAGDANGQTVYVPLSPNGTNSNNHDGDSMRQNTFKFIVPNHALDAYCGSNMTVSHFLRVKICTVCCMTSPESSLNVQIAHVSIPPATKGYGGVNITSIEMTPPPFAPSYEASESGGPNHVSLPPDWSPQTAEMVALPITSGVDEDPYPMQATVTDVNSEEG